MDISTLRQLQAPLKARYREDGSTALTPVQAAADLTGPGVACVVAGWAGPVTAGLHEATGGDGSHACSADMLLEALVACAGVTMRSVALALHIEVRAGELRGFANFDARGTLGVSKEVPVGCTDIRVQADLDTDASPDQLARLAQLTERYCVVGQSLRSEVTFDVRSITPGP